ncbi:MAG: membrane dipeptidase [Cryomorphaceae bacterium]|jgi:membrane dipeptidase
MITAYASTPNNEKTAVLLTTKELVLQIHEQNILLDAHADIVLPTTSKAYLDENGESKVSPAKLTLGGMGVVVMSVAVGPGPRSAKGDAQARLIADQKLLAVRVLLEDAEHNAVLATSLAEIIAAKEQGKIAILLGFQNARSLQGDVANLDYFYQQGVRVFGLNHLGHNDFSDSSRPFYHSNTASYEPASEHGGLSELGVTAIHRINALGALVDISQMSQQAALQTLTISRAPVIASHSNARAITNVSRNLSDIEFDKIALNGGVVHVAAFGAYLVDLSAPATLDAIIEIRLKHGLPKEYSYPYELYWELDDQSAKQAFLIEMRSAIGAGAVSDMVKHIDYIVRRIGIDHVGIGNDFNHGSGIQGFADASQARNLTAALIEHGYSIIDIEKIWGGNFLRVLGEAERLAGGAQ